MSIFQLLVTLFLAFNLVNCGELQPSEVSKRTEQTSDQSAATDQQDDEGPKSDEKEQERSSQDLMATEGSVDVEEKEAQEAKSQETESTSSIASVLANDGNFETLLAALEAADLAATFDSPGDYTLFAPTDKAFAALGDEVIAALLEDKEQLTSILTYHVTAGAFPAAKVVAMNEIETLQGQSVQVKVKGGNVYIDEAKIMLTDIPANNGVIHVLSAVLTPEMDSPVSIIDKLESLGNFATLLAALELTDLTQTVREGSFTLFAPTDDAFAKIPESDLNALLEQPEVLKDILLFHVVAGEVEASQVIEKNSLAMVNGGTNHIQYLFETVFIGHGRVTTADIFADNGIIHEIDTVLIP